MRGGGGGRWRLMWPLKTGGLTMSGTAILLTIIKNDSTAAEDLYLFNKLWTFFPSQIPEQTSGISTTTPDYRNNEIPNLPT